MWVATKESWTEQSGLSDHHLIVGPSDRAGVGKGLRERCMRAGG